MGVSIGLVLSQPALRHPGRVAVVEVDARGRREHTYADLDGAARRAAAALRARGVGPGDRVALMAANGADFVAGWFGIVYAGAVVVPVPILDAAPEVAHRLAAARCRLVLTDGPRREVAERAGAAERLALGDLVAETVAPLDRPADAAPGDPAMILFTSGTTGAPRGALLSHAALLTHTATLVEHTLGHGPDDRLLGVLPLTHSFGCRMVMLAGLYVGARLVLVPRFHAERTFALLEEEAITWLPAVPTMFAAWAEVEGAAPPALRWCLAAGAPLPEDLARRAEARLGAEVRGGYGMTEATFSTVNAPPDRRVFGSVGRPVWGVEVRITDEDDRDLPPGTEGRVLLRGPNLMTGYLDDPEATAEALRGGWMHSGDLGRLDPEGRLEVVGRTKDLILRGGHNVYPAEVEAVLAAHPDVAQVVVVGRPDPYYGEEVVAFVVPREGARPRAEDVVAFARERISLAKYPREVYFVDRLPLGPSGKILRRALRRRWEDPA